MVIDGVVSLMDGIFQTRRAKMPLQPCLLKLLRDANAPPSQGCRGENRSWESKTFACHRVQR